MPHVSDQLGKMRHKTKPRQEGKETQIGTEPPELQKQISKSKKDLGMKLKTGEKRC